MLQKYNRLFLYTTSPYSKRQKCVAKQQYILLKQLYVLYKLVVGKCDVEESDDIAMEFGVRNIPTILFFKGGQLVDNFVGAASKSKIEGKFKALL